MFYIILTNELKLSAETVWKQVIEINYGKLSNTLDTK